jgi:hypothetical protein
MDDGTGRSEAELMLRQSAALLGSALIGILHVIDTVLEAWPLPTSRARRPDGQELHDASSHGREVGGSPAPDAGNPPTTPTPPR